MIFSNWDDVLKIMNLLSNERNTTIDSLPVLARQTSESASLANRTSSLKCLPAAHWPCYKVNCRGHAVGFLREHLSSPKIRWKR